MTPELFNLLAVLFSIIALILTIQMLVNINSIARRARIQNRMLSLLIIKFGIDETLINRIMEENK